MAIEFFTGFEGCGRSGDVRSLFDVAYSVAYSSSGGYANGKCIQATGFNQLFKQYCIPAKRKAMGCHVRNLGNRTYSADSNYRFLYFEGPKIGVNNTPSGLDVRVAGSPLGVFGIPINTDIHHVEMEVYSHPTEGEVKIKVDDVVVVDLTAVNTGGEDITACVFGSGYSSAACCDNVYIADTLQGELFSLLRKPSEDVSVEFTPSMGEENYALISEAAQDGDASYVESNTLGQEDLYKYEEVSAVYEIKGVSLVTFAKKSEAGERLLRVKAEQGMVSYDIGEEVALPLEYPTAQGSDVLRILETAPDGTSWDATKFNAIKWGFRVSG